MANTLRFKRGLASGIPTALAGEPLFTTDTFDLYIGNGTTNTRFQKYIASGTTSQYIRGDGTLATFPSLTGFVPYTGATANVDLGTHTILAQNATISSSGSGNTATITHSSGSGIALNITKGGNGEGLYINKTSGSGNAATIIGTLNATTLVKSGGTSTQYLMADGSTSTLTNPITGSGSAGQVAYFTGATTQGGSNNLFWDNTNGRLGVGTNNPSYTFHAISSAATIGAFRNNGAAIGQLLVGNTAADMILRILASGDSLIYSDTGKYLAFGSNGGTERVRIFSNGNFGIGTGATDTGQKLQVIGTSYFSDNTAIGSTSLIARTNLTVWKNITGDPTSFGVYSRGTIQSGVTTDASYYASVSETAAASFTLTALKHYRAVNAGFGAGSTVTNQYAFIAESTITGATNNYGFYGDIPSGTNRWNLYMNGTANNYMAGQVAIGHAVVPDPAVAWTRALVIGNSGTNKIITGYLGSATAGATLGAVNSALSSWAELNIAGSTLIFRSNGETEGMRLTSARNLHIGTYVSDSGEKLQVTGTMKVTGASTFGGNITIGTQGIGTGIFWNNTNNRLGIGTNLPSTNLHVSSSTGTTFTIGSTNAGSIASPVETRLNFIGYGDFNNAQIAAQNKAQNLGGGWLLFRTADSSGVLQDRMELDRNGNLGLGVTPSYKLDVQGTGTATLARFVAPGNVSILLSRAGITDSGDAQLTVTNLGALSITAASTIRFISGSTQYGAFAGATGNLMLQNGGTYTDSGERLQVTGTAKITGNVGIGTTSDVLYPLKVERSSAGVGIQVYNSTTYSQIRLQSSGTNQSSYLTFNPTGTGRAVIQVSDTDRLTIDTSGNLAVDTNTLFVDATNNRVGVLTATPTTTLDVGGNATIGLTSTTGYSLVVQNSGATDATGIRLTSGGTDNGYFITAYNSVSKYASLQAGDNTAYRSIILNGLGGNVGIGTNSVNASARFQVDSTTQGVLPPRMTTTQKVAIASPAAGLIVYDTTSNKLCCYNGTTWNDLF